MVLWGLLILFHDFTTMSACVHVLFFLRGEADEAWHALRRALCSRRSVSRQGPDPGHIENMDDPGGERERGDPRLPSTTTPPLRPSSLSMPRLDFFPLLSSDDGVPTETSTTQHEIEHELSAILQNARSRGSLSVQAFFPLVLVLVPSVSRAPTHFAETTPTPLLHPHRQANA